MEDRYKASLGPDWPFTKRTRLTLRLNKQVVIEIGLISGYTHLGNGPGVLRVNKCLKHVACNG
jgi:hypothetical protein